MKMIYLRRKGFNPQELAILESDFQKHRKSPVVLWLLWLFYCILGHRYYLGDKGRYYPYHCVYTNVNRRVLFVSRY